MPTAKNPPVTRMLSAKKTARPHAARYPTTALASAPAPNLAGVRASVRSPAKSPATAACPGRARIA